MSNNDANYSAAALIEKANKMAPFLRESRFQIDESRRIPREIADKMLEAGFFRMTMPKSWGGPELNSMQQVELIEAVSKGNASAGWCLMIGSDSGIYSGYLEEPVAKKLYPKLDMIQAGWVYPGGRAKKVDGGYLLTGKWKFGSGINNADNICAGAIILEDGKPVMTESGAKWRVFIASADQFRIQDNWHTTGLKGTGSNDYICRDVFIPDEHSFDFLAPAKREGVLWQAPDTFLRKMAGIPLGCARATLDEAKALFMEKEDFVTGIQYRDVTRIQTAIAESEMRLNAARAYLFQTLERQWSALEKNQPIDKALRADCWMSRLNVFQEAHKIINLLYNTVGGAAVYAHESGFDMALRDSHTWIQHMVGQEKGLEAVGALLLDGKPIAGYSFL